MDWVDAFECHARIELLNALLSWPFPVPAHQRSGSTFSCTTSREIQQRSFWRCKGFMWFSCEVTSFHGDFSETSSPNWWRGAPCVRDSIGILGYRLKTLKISYNYKHVETPRIVAKDVSDYCKIGVPCLFLHIYTRFSWHSTNFQKKENCKRSSEKKQKCCFRWEGKIQ